MAVSNEAGGIMRAFHYSAAICATAIILIAAGAGVVTFQMIQQPMIPHSRSIDVGRELRTFFTSIVSLSVVAGIVGWLVRLGLRRDGLHRLAAVDPIFRRNL